MRVDKRCMTIVSDNGCVLSDDLVRRAVIVRFEVDERAGDRSEKLKHHLDEHWLNKSENRGRILSIWWAFVRNWLETGKQPGSHGHAFVPNVDERGRRDRFGGRVR